MFLWNYVQFQGFIFCFSESKFWLSHLEWDEVFFFFELSSAAHLPPSWVGSRTCGHSLLTSHLVEWAAGPVGTRSHSLIPSHLYFLLQWRVLQSYIFISQHVLFKASSLLSMLKPLLLKQPVNNFNCYHLRTWDL